MKTKQFHRHFSKWLLLSTLFFLIVIICFTGCIREEDHHVHVSPNNLTFYGNYSKQYENLRVETEGEWFISEVSPFIEVQPWRGVGAQSLSVRMAEKNEGRGRRYGIIVVKSFEEPKYSDTVNVCQEGGAY